MDPRIRTKISWVRNTASRLKEEERKKKNHLTLSPVGSWTVVSCPLAGLLKLKPSDSGVKTG
jgi:hypothetical protein